MRTQCGDVDKWSELREYGIRECILIPTVAQLWRLGHRHTAFLRVQNWLFYDWHPRRASNETGQRRLGGLIPAYCIHMNEGEILNCE